MEKTELNKLTKLYYTIGEVADMFSVNTSLIRFWEKEFNIIQPKKSKKGNRMFTQKDIENFNKIYNLVKVDGHTLEGAKRALKEKTPKSAEDKSLDDSNNKEVISTLEKIKARLLKLR